MPRHVKGVTLTPEERVQVVREKITSHTCTVVLPNDLTCSVTYTRHATRYHCFEFGPPLKDRRWISERLIDSAEIEAKAQSLSIVVFESAQQREQQDKRRQPPSGRSSGKAPEISASLAAQLGGTYAVCVQCHSGSMIRIGVPHEKPAQAQQEMKDGAYRAVSLHNGKRLVVGICNRVLQRWEEPIFLATLRQEPPPTDAGNTPEPAEHEVASADLDTEAYTPNQEGAIEGGYDD